MNIALGINNIPESLPYPAVTIGNFDGVHKGHQVLLKKTCDIAEKNNGSAIAFTFEPHPLKIISPENCPPLLTSYTQKMKWIESYGIDLAICADFNSDFANQSPRSFAENILCKKIGAREVVVGFDYAFGKGREGTISHLKEMGKEFNFIVHVIEPVKSNGHMVSSSSLREMIGSGRVETAKELLGRNYSLQGEVIHGRKRGKDLGFPTANLKIEDAMAPATGVYAVNAFLDSQRKHAVANVGYNPTFGSKELNVEAHIFEFNEDIYGKTMEIEFVSRIRDEIKFSSVESLTEQIRKDILKAKNILEFIS